MRGDAILGRWRGQRRSLAAIALTAALLLLTAPLRASVGGCDLCPPDCPMHAAHRGGAHAEQQRHGTPRLRCHNAPASADSATSAPRISRPPCGAHAAITGLDLAPMLPGGALSWRWAPRVAAAPPGSASSGGRCGEPPDTPPPDVAA